MSCSKELPHNTSRYFAQYVLIVLRELVGVKTAQQPKDQGLSGNCAPSTIHHYLVRLKCSTITKVTNLYIIAFSCVRNSNAHILRHFHESTISCCTTDGGS